MGAPISYDVIVVGAGPAGCAAAYDLAGFGCSVLLLDRAEFPRKKPCAGGFTMKALRSLRFSIDHLVQRTCRHCVLDYGQYTSKTLSGKDPIVAMTVRSEFDTYHLERCIERGVHFVHVGDNVELSGDMGRWQAETPERTYRAAYLIGADGAHSQVRRHFGLFPERTLGFALETTVAVDNPMDFEMSFDFGVVANGYAWTFPKGDHLNVGLYAMGKIPDARNRLTQFCQQQFGGLPLGEIVSHPLPLGGHAFRHRPGTPLLVGDAAGLVDPLMGEGLYNAIRSGQLAAEAVSAMMEGKPDPYDQLIREITLDLKSYRRETLFFYKHPRWGYRALTFPPIAYVLMKGYSLGRPVRWLKHRAPLIPFMRHKRS